MDYENKSAKYYNNNRHEMLTYLPKNPKTILDIGCGSGVFAKILKQKTKAETWGIEFVDAEAQIAKTKLDKVFSGPCEDFLDDLPNDYFDVIYCNDVLEHLVDPELVLTKLKNKLTKDGVVISSIPNIRYHNTFMRLMLKKDWIYNDHGVMDKTHLRWFTKKSIHRMYEELGYTVIQHEGINKSKSIKPWLYNIPVLFTHLDIRYPQFATVVSFEK